MKKRKKMKYDHMALFSEGEASTQSQPVGTIFRKQIAKFGKWVNPLYPIEFMELDKEWAQELVDNFEAGIIERVPVPLDHTDATEANTCELMKLEIDEDGLYGYLDIRRPNVVEDINNGLIFDVSISFDWDYIDTETGKHHGATLLHVALVNNPYLKGMPAFEEALDVAFSKVATKMRTALALPKTGSVIMLSETKVKELSNMETATVINDRDFDVTISVKDEDGESAERVLKPGEQVEVPKDQAESVTSSIADATDPSDDDDDKDDDTETDEERAAREKKEAEDKDDDDDSDDDEDLDDDEKSELSRLRKQNRKNEVEKQFDTLLSDGKVVPAQKEKFMELANVETASVQLSGGKKATLSEIVAGIIADGNKQVSFSENGSNKDGGDDDSKDNKDNKKPSEALSDPERQGMQAVGADPKRMDELADKHPAMRDALNNIDKKERT